AATPVRWLRAAAAATSAARPRKSPAGAGLPDEDLDGSGREQRLHLLQRVGLDLADALGRYAVFVGQLLQRDLAFVIEPATHDDVARARIQAGHAFAQQAELVVLAAVALVGLGRILFARDQERRGRRRCAFVVLVRRRVEADVAARQARFHLQ